MSPCRPTVLHLINSLEGGGTEAALIRLVNALSATCLRQRILTVRPGSAAIAQLRDGVSCHPLGIHGKDPWAFLRILPHLRECGPIRGRRGPTVLIHARGVGCWTDAMLAHLLRPRSRLILGFHGTEDGAPFTRSLRLLIRLASMLGAQFTTVSRDSRLKLITAEAPPDRVTVLENGISLAEFTRARHHRELVRRQMGWDDDRQILICAAALKPVKDHETLIRAFGEMAAGAPRLNLVLAGDGPIRGELTALAERLRLRDRIHFLGHRQNLPELLAAADIFALTSRSEGMSNAMLEALAAGLPVITTRIADHDQIIREGIEGCLVDPGDVPALARVLVALTQDPARLLTFREASILRARSFTLDRMAAEYAAFYSRLLTPGRKRVGGGAPRPSPDEEPHSRQHVARV